MALAPRRRRMARAWPFNLFACNLPLATETLSKKITRNVRNPRMAKGTPASSEYALLFTIPQESDGEMSQNAELLGE